MTRNRSLIAVVAVTTAIVMSVAGAITASAGGRAESPANQIAGTWDVTVDRAEPLSDLKSLQTFTGDGSIIEIANVGTALRSPSHGAWERLDGRRYASTMVFFRYDPQSGAYARYAEDREHAHAVAGRRLVFGRRGVDPLRPGRKRRPRWPRRRYQRRPDPRRGGGLERMARGVGATTLP